MRFDDEGYLQAWSQEGRYPAIHDDLYRFVMVYGAVELHYLDLACSTGLLGQRLRDAGYKVVGVDRDRKAIELAGRHGVPLTIEELEVDAAHPAPLVELLEVYGITAIIARRCFPEIIGEDLSRAPILAKALHAAGVHEIFIEGRQWSRASRHPLGHISAEVKALEPWYRLDTLNGNLALVVAVR